MSHRFIQHVRCSCRCCTHRHYTKLHHNVPHCTTLHHTAPHCITLQHTATHRNTPQHKYTQYVRCNCRSCTHRHCTTLHHTAPHCNTVQHSATHHSIKIPNTSVAPAGVALPSSLPVLCQYDRKNAMFRQKGPHIYMYIHTYIYTYIYTCTYIYT